MHRLVQVPIVPWASEAGADPGGDPRPRSIPSPRIRSARRRPTRRRLARALPPAKLIPTESAVGDVTCGPRAIVKALPNGHHHPTPDGPPGNLKKQTRYRPVGGQGSGYVGDVDAVASTRGQRQSDSSGAAARVRAAEDRELASDGARRPASSSTLSPRTSRGWPPAPSGLVFVNSAGGGWSRNRLAPEFAKAARAAGLPEGTTSHSLRHHFASLLIAGGCSVKSVQDRLGHASPMETLAVYAHLWPNDEDVTRAAVERAWAEDAPQARGLLAE